MPDKPPTEKTTAELVAKPPVENQVDILADPKDADSHLEAVLASMKSRAPAQPGTAGIRLFGRGGVFGGPSRTQTTPTPQPGLGAGRIQPAEIEAEPSPNPARPRRRRSGGQEQLETALTQRAIGWLDLLEDDVDENGHPTTDLRVQIEIFKLASDWLLKLQRMKAGLPEDTAAEGIKALQALIEDVEEINRPARVARAKARNAKPKIAPPRRIRDTQDGRLRKLVNGATP